MWPLSGFELRFCFCYQPLLCLCVVDQEISTTAVYEDVSSDITKPPHNIAFHQNRPSSFKSSNGAHFLWPLIFFFATLCTLKTKECLKQDLLSHSKAQATGQIHHLGDIQPKMSIHIPHHDSCVDLCSPDHADIGIMHFSKFPSGFS